MPTTTPAVRRRLASLLALLLLTPLAFSACSAADILPHETSGSTTIRGVCPQESASSGFGGQVYTPRQMRIAYGVETLCQQGYTGKGQTVILIESFGSPTIQADLDAYSQRFNLPLTKVDVRAPLSARAASGTEDAKGWAVETTLDVETVHAIAPEAKIVVLTSPVAETQGVVGLPEFRWLQQYAVDHRLGNIVSQSYGASELSLDDAAGRAELQEWNDFYQRATTQQGMTFVASSGDGGATNYATEEDARTRQLASVPTTSFPANSPWVLAVGGTVLAINGATLQEAQESAWPKSGGGFSAFYSTPSYQQMLPASAQSQLQNRRGVPDVAASADSRAGLVISYQGRYRVIGGTSASAPLWAALIAIGNQMAGHPLGFVNPAIYQIGTSDKAAQDFRDITTGNNSWAGVPGYDAAPGWDPVTGFGSPIAEKLLPNLVAASSQPRVPLSQSHVRSLPLDS
jgi:subtilase family serine protease